MRVYKVVGRGQRRGEQESAVVYGHALVTYRRGQWATAPAWLAQRGYHLLAFRSLQAARRFVKEWESPGTWSIWEADGEGLVDLPEQGICSFCLAWQGWPCDRPSIGWPRGTVMVKRLRLRRLVRGPKERAR